MTTKRFCDRCGREASNYARLERSAGSYRLDLTARNINLGHSDQADLCEECLLVLWAEAE